MKRKILFIHSAGPQHDHQGSSDFVRHLQQQLGAGYSVLAPLMPDPDNPDYERWAGKLGKEFTSIKEELILVGHSLGGSVILKFLSENRHEKTICGLFLVAVPFWGKKDWKIQEFTLRKNFVSLLPPIPKIFLYHSKRDPWVPFSHQKAYAKIFASAKAHEIEGDDHEFKQGLPQLVDDIKSLNQK